MSKGKVYLVGAGVGSLAYLTHRGEALLRSADVIVGDALVDAELLQIALPNCIQHHTGKRGGLPSTPQAEINRLLVDYCQQGKQVVRLKSGDPLIFGRAREEIEALQAAGCEFELVPGISSALAAPLLAGIPLTDKVLSRTFAILSAHQPEMLDWEALSRMDTLVILMGGRSLGQVVEQLCRWGRSRACPIAIVRHCGRPEQHLWLGTLDNILEQTAGISLSPSVMIVGEVVRYSKSMSQNLVPVQPPLLGKTVLVTRAAEQSSAFTQLLQREGARVMEMPALAIGPPSSWEALDEAIARLDTFHWLILTSSNGVDFFFDRLTVLGKDARALGGVKIAVVGKKTAAALQLRALSPDFVPPDFVADALVEHFPEALHGQSVLFPRVETGGREVLVRELRDRGAGVTEVPTYQSSCPERIAPEVLEALRAGKVDIITFASSKTARNFCRLLEDAIAEEPKLPRGQQVCIASIGPQTSQTCYELFERVDVEAREYTLEGLTRAIVEWSQQQKRG